jgi:HPt (histidine-containing phosphotransfer) domain-containing protein
MASPNIAFTAPELDSARCPSQSRPIDLVYLATQTKGDKEAEMENLQAFARQARACLQSIGTGELDAARAAVHRLQGAASAVGAFRVSAAASAVESEGVDAARLAAVGAAVIEAQNFILKLCR